MSKSIGMVLSLNKNTKPSLKIIFIDIGLFLLLVMDAHFVVNCFKVSICLTLNHLSDNFKRLLVCSMSKSSIFYYQCIVFM